MNGSRRCLRGGFVTCVVACGLAVVGAQRAGAEITPNLVVVDVGPLQETGEDYVTYRLMVVLSGADDWTSAELTATVTDATFYQDPNNDGNPPDPAGFATYPDSEVTSYYTSPGDYPNAAYSGTAVGFNAGPTETDTSLAADWFDGSDSGDGTFVIAQLTVLPDSSSWSGQVDVTVYSVNNPGGVTDSFVISDADYEAPVTTTYIGPCPGTYNDANNWDIGVVPLNGLPDTLDRYNVIIPESCDIDFDAGCDRVVNGLSLGCDTTLSFLAGQCLLVRGTSVISGIIDALGPDTTFLAPSQFAAFADDCARVHVSAGAVVHVAAPSYRLDLGDYRADIDILSSNGADSQLDLSSVTMLNVPFSAGGTYGDYVWTYTIAATNDGVIDLSNATSLTGASGNDWLRLYLAGGGNIDLSSLGVVNGRTWFDVDVEYYALPDLESASSAHIDVAGARTLDLGSLTVFTDGMLEVSPDAIVNAPQLTSFGSSTMLIHDYGTVNAPVLTTFYWSDVELNPSRVLNSPPFTNIDHSRLIVAGGATLAPAATVYTFNRGDFRQELTILSSDGADSQLDLSSVTMLNVPFSAGGTYGDYVWTYTIAATNDGVIDLSNAENLAGASGNDWLRLYLADGGNIDLSRLALVSGRTLFEMSVPVYELPDLQSTADTIVLNLGVGTDLNLPVLENILGSNNSLSIPVFATFNAPALNQVRGTTINLDVGGTLNTPNLRTFTWSTFAIVQADQGDPFLNVPPFTNIDHSRLYVYDGGSFAVAAPSYTFDWGDHRVNMDILSSDGTGSLLDLTSLESIEVPFAAYGGYGSNPVWTYSIAATNNGVIDLSNVTNVTGASNNDWLRLITLNGGSIVFGDVAISGGGTRLVAEGSSSSFHVGGNLELDTPSQLSLGADIPAPTLHLGGDLSFNHTEEADFNTGGGIFHMNGSGTQLLEVASEDVDVPDGPVSNNFEIGQLIVGEMDQDTVVRLVDAVDNGNRGASGVEALYLQGLPGNGLRILGGSTLVIENIQVYAQDVDVWVHINSLFESGENQIEYDQGFISLSIVETDCNVNGIDDRVDILLGNSDDCNGNIVPDECDIDFDSPAPGGPFYCIENCDPDCNVNGIPDQCDVDEGTSEDCNENGLPDECEIDQGTGEGYYCDPADPPPPLTSCDPDENGNGIPDECEDCNGNEIPDFQDLADCDGSLWCSDCNGNNTLDVCDLDGCDGSAWCSDCNINGILDECDIADCQGDPACEDCQPNGVPDGCDIAEGTSTDLNGNGTPDECDEDCNSNGIPDDQDIADCDGSPWCGDCNGNDIPDWCDIDDATSPDGNGNGIPDECDFTPTASGEGCRYLGITPAAEPDAVALLVVGDPGDPRVSCISGYVQIDGTLDTDPAFQVPADWATVHVGDQEMIEGASYSVQADFGTPGNPMLSLPAAASIPAWGDLNDDGFVSGYDLLMFVDAYRGDLPYWIGDLCPEVPDGLVNGVDLLCWIDAYRSEPYPYWDCIGRGRGGSDREPPPPAGLDEVVLAIAPKTGVARPGIPVHVDVFVEGAEDLRLFQVAIDVDGGRSGGLTLREVLIDEQRRDFAFVGHSPVSITDLVDQRAVSALWDGGESTVGWPRYLATFVFIPSRDASGTFKLKLRDDPGTLLRDSSSLPIAVSRSAGATIKVDSVHTNLTTSDMNP